MKNGKWMYSKSHAPQFIQNETETETVRLLKMKTETEKMMAGSGKTRYYNLDLFGSVKPCTTVSRTTFTNNLAEYSCRIICE